MGCECSKNKSFILNKEDEKRKIVTSSTTSNRRRVEILATTLTENSGTLIVNPNHTISSIKAKIEEKLGINTQQQKIVYAGRILKDNRTIKGYNIEHESIIYIIKSSRNSPSKVIHGKHYQIFVKTLNQKTITLDVERTDTIKNIKDKIYKTENILPDDEKLIFRGKSFCPLTAIKDIGIGPKSTIHLVSKLRSDTIPPDTLLNAVYIESISYWSLYQLLPINLDINMMKIIWEYSDPLDLNVMKTNSKCTDYSNCKKSIDCKGSLYLDLQILEEQVNKAILWKENKSYDGFYGLYLKFEFKSYQTKYNKTWTFAVDIDLINDANIEEFIEITDLNNKIPLKFCLYGLEKKDDIQFIIIQIDESSLRKKEIEKLFVNNKLKINILIHEKELPLIYNGGIVNKGSLIGDMRFTHFIHRI